MTSLDYFSFTGGQWKNKPEVLLGLGQKNLLVSPGPQPQADPFQIHCNFWKKSVYVCPVWGLCGEDGEQGQQTMAN